MKFKGQEFKVKALQSSERVNASSLTTLLTALHESGRQSDSHRCERGDHERDFLPHIGPGS